MDNGQKLEEDYVDPAEAVVGQMMRDGGPLWPSEIVAAVREADGRLCDCDVPAPMRHWRDTCPYGVAATKPCELVGK